MARTIVNLIAVLALTAVTATAQDARTVLQAAAKNMGADTLRTIEISGTGMNAAVGQELAPGTDWPRFEITDYSKFVDYENRASREQLTRRQGNNPPQGGGGTPLQGEQQQEAVLSGTFAWNVQGTTANPAAAATELRQLDIVMTPHRVPEAALAPGANPTAYTRTSQLPGQPGRRVTVVSFTALGKYKVSGAITDQNLVKYIKTWIANPVLGDMLYEESAIRSTGLRGREVSRGGHPHAPGQSAAGRRAQLVPAHGEGRPGELDCPRDHGPRQRSTGIRTARHQGSVSEAGRRCLVHRRRRRQQRRRRVQGLRAIVESPTNEQRSIAVIDEARRLVPAKPIRYLVNTHHHFDHLGGIRTFVAEGATIITHQRNRDFYERVVFSPAPADDRARQAVDYAAGAGLRDPERAVHPERWHAGAGDLRRGPGWRKTRTC